MKLRLFVTNCLLLLTLQVADAQDRFLVSKDSLSGERRTEISMLLRLIKSNALRLYPHEVSAYWSSSDYMRLFRCRNLKEYAERLVVNDSRVYSICLTDSIFTVTYEPDFYQFQTNDEMYYLFTELYKNIFYYEQIKSISIILTDGNNLTFLPTINSDLWIPMENALLKRELFLPDVDYIDLLGVSDVEAGRYLNDNSEYSEEKIAAKVTEYRNMIEGN